MKREQGSPDWGAAITAAQSRLAVVIAPDPAAERTRRAMTAFGANPLAAPADDGEPEPAEQEGS